MSITTAHHALSLQRPGADAPNAPLLVAVPDAARLLGIGTTLAWELVRAGEIPSVKLGRRVLVPRAALEHLAHSSILAATAQEVNSSPDTPHPLAPTPRRDTAANGSALSSATSPR